MSSQPLTEAELGRIFERHYPMVYRRALRLLGSPQDAEDAMQEIFIRAFRATATFDAGRGVSSWLYTITTNYCLNRLRDLARRRALHDEEQPEDPASLVEPARLVLLRHLLARADETLARAAVCVYIEGMSQAEAAEVLGVSQRTVGNYLERFLAFARAEAASLPALESRSTASLPRRRAE